jgi:nicotinamide-nucleotide amidase
VGSFQEREMVLDGELEQRIAEIVQPLMKRWPNLDVEAIHAGTRKQATIPAGATVLEPVGTAPGLVVPPREPGAPTVVVLPGPPRELQPMWSQALATEALGAALKDATSYRQRMLRLFGIPESEIAETLRVAEREGVALDRLEITTCLKRGEIEVVTRYEPEAESAYQAFVGVVEERHADTLFSADGSSVDEQVAALLDGRSIATAESCTGGLLAARLTEQAGASAYLKGGIVAYDNEVKIAQAGVDRELIERHGAVSAEVAQALADGARSRLGADVGVGVTGVAGPGGGSEEKPVGLVWLTVSGPQETHMTRSVNLPGGRADIRDRATTVAMHMIRRVLAES